MSLLEAQDLAKHFPGATRHELVRGKGQQNVIGIDEVERVVGKAFAQQHHRGDGTVAKGGEDVAALKKRIAALEAQERDFGK